MNPWLEPERRIARKGDVLIDSQGLLIRVMKTDGSLSKRWVWAENVNGTEVYSNEPEENFTHASPEITNSFYKEYFAIRGYSVGTICTYKKDDNIPLEIVQVDWSKFRQKVIICSKDLRQFNSEILKTEEMELLVPSPLAMPNIETILNKSDSSLKWRINLSVTETENNGWTVTGGIFDFQEKDDAYKEIEIWKSRLLIRRVASVINGSWTPSFPSWFVESSYVDGEFRTRVAKTVTFNGAPAYFPTALHAAHAAKIVTINDWRNSIGFTSDIVEI